MIAVYRSAAFGETVRVRQHARFKCRQADDFSTLHKRRVLLIHRISFHEFSGQLRIDFAKIILIVFWRQIFISKNRAFVGVESEEQIHIVDILRTRIHRVIFVEEKALQHGIRTRSTIGTVLTEKPRFQ